MKEYNGVAMLSGTKPPGGRWVVISNVGLSMVGSISFRGRHPLAANGYKREREGSISEGRHALSRDRYKARLVLCREDLRRSMV